jgi:hypothetical protein
MALISSPPPQKFASSRVNIEVRKVTYGITSHGKSFTPHVKLIGHLLSAIMTPVTELGDRRTDICKPVQRIPLKP